MADAAPAATEAAAAPAKCARPTLASTLSCVKRNTVLCLKFLGRMVVLFFTSLWKLLLVLCALAWSSLVAGCAAGRKYGTKEEREKRAKVRTRCCRRRRPTSHTPTTGGQAGEEEPRQTDRSPERVRRVRGRQAPDRQAAVRGEGAGCCCCRRAALLLRPPRLRLDYVTLATTPSLTYTLSLSGT